VNAIVLTATPVTKGQGAAGIANVLLAVYPDIPEAQRVLT
jgi:hypothetical protein